MSIIRNTALQRKGCETQIPTPASNRVFENGRPAFIRGLERSAGLCADIERPLDAGPLAAIPLVQHIREIAEEYRRAHKVGDSAARELAGEALLIATARLPEFFKASISRAGKQFGVETMPLWLATALKALLQAAEASYRHADDLDRGAFFQHLAKRGASVSSDTPNAGEITWPAGISTPVRNTAITQLKARGVILR